ncbi:MAG TPA: aromatic ring-hydroxylating dioxygenase subunit alpha [Chloroflexia bacterium]|nr:aromatic ring-hydroxylating dioxygenase subunit alpha [Chloroflexia bacterium]
MMIPDQWYAVLESDEVKPGKPAAFRRLNHDLVFWRDDSDKLVVMQDRCPHRQTKLSGGKIVNNSIECPFHGFQYNESGECQLVPANGKNGPRPKQFRAKAYPVREAHGFIWVWNGEPRPKKDYPPIPFFDGLENFSYGTLRKEWNTHYTRAIENQLDVAHVPFVHATTIGREGKTLVNGPYSLIEGDAIYVWYDNQKDHGQHANKPSELPRPDRPWLLCFKYPNVWLNRLSDKMMIMAAFVPIDDEHTMMYVRFYHNFVKSGLARKLISALSPFANSRILKQDEAVVVSQEPKEGGLDSGDKYIPADRPILLYHTHRQELIRAAALDHEFNTREAPEYSEERVAS